MPNTKIDDALRKFLKDPGNVYDDIKTLQALMLVAREYLRRRAEVLSIKRGPYDYIIILERPTYVSTITYATTFD